MSDGTGAAVFIGAIAVAAAIVWHGKTEIVRTDWGFVVYDRFSTKVKACETPPKNDALFADVLCWRVETDRAKPLEGGMTIKRIE